MCIAHNRPTHTQYGIFFLHVILSSEMWVELLLKKRLKNEFSTNWIQYIVYISQIAQRVIGFFSALLFNQYNVYPCTQTQTHLLLCNFVYWFFLILIFTSCVSLFLIHSLTVSHEYHPAHIWLHFHLLFVSVAIGAQLLFRKIENVEAEKGMMNKSALKMIRL